ncbi:Heat Labile Enterotoxin Type Iib, partial [Metarhizium hybridum]
MENPSESCVPWAVCGVRKLQEVGILERFDTVGFADKALEYGEARLALLDSDDPDIDADRFDINRCDAHQGRIVEEPRDAFSLPCERAGVPCVAINTNVKDAESKGPTVERTQAGELIAEASKKSKESFNRPLEEYNFSSVAKQDKLYTKPIDRIAGFTNKIARSALAVAGLALYGKAVADVFSSNASILNKAAVASQLTGDLYAAHRVLSENATSPAAQDQGGAGADVGAYVRPELKRQICATIAEAKHQRYIKLEGIALNHIVKLEREFKKQFLDK